MTLNKALYGRRCRFPIWWFEVGEAEFVVPYLVHQAMEKVKVIQERLRIAQSCQKYYTDVSKRELEFKVDNWYTWKFHPGRVLWDLVRTGSLSPGTYKISKRIINVAYELELPQELAATHPIFHIPCWRSAWEIHHWLYQLYILVSNIAYLMRRIMFRF